jgi:hypothetical protein
MSGSKQKPPKRQKAEKESPPDYYALRKLLRTDRKPVGGWVKLGKYTKLKGTVYA